MSAAKTAPGSEREQGRRIDPKQFAETMALVLRMERTTAQLYVRRLKESGLIPSGSYGRKGKRAKAKGVTVREAVVLMLGFLASSTAGGAPDGAVEAGGLVSAGVKTRFSEALDIEDRSEARGRLAEAATAELARRKASGGPKRDTSSLAEVIVSFIQDWIEAGGDGPLPEIEVHCWGMPRMAYLSFSTSPSVDLVMQFGTWPENAFSAQSRTLSIGALNVLFSPFLRETD